MPEAAELETLRRQILPYLPLSVTSVDVRGHRSVRAHHPDDLQNLVGAELTEVVRKGKWLGLSGDPVGVRVHLRMSGRLHMVESSVPLSRHDHVVVGVVSAGQHLSLRFFDPRTFGEVAIWRNEHLGSEVADVLDGARLALELPRYESRRTVKAVLLDQRSIVQGLGNIYVDELCHLAGIDPAMSWTSLTMKQRVEIARLVPQVIEAGTSHRGTALADEGWLDLHGEIGGHGPHLHVHARTHCADCHAPVERFKLAGRSTYRCKTCLREA